MWLELTQSKNPVFVNMALIVKVQGHSTGSTLTVAAPADNAIIGVDQPANVIMTAIGQSGETAVWASQT